MMSVPFTRTRVTWMAYILLACYAYFLNILGPITPFLHDEFQLSYTVSSLHFTAFAIGMLLTPPDVFSQTFLAIPMWLLFESGLVMARILLPPAEESPESDQASS